MVSFDDFGESVELARGGSREARDSTEGSTGEGGMDRSAVSKDEIVDDVPAMSSKSDSLEVAF